MKLHTLALGMVLALAGAAPAAAAELLGPGVISTGLQETTAAFSPDGQELYFLRSDFAETDDTILVSQHQGKGWSLPKVASFSGQWHDSEPAFAPDGKRLYFVSNRPVRAGAAPLVAEMMGQHFAGTNLWYVERQANGQWSEPRHVDGALNDGAMLYNPSVAANGDIYFSAHRADSGQLYQIYVVHPVGDGYSTPQRVDLGDVAHNRMDPCIDPRGRFLLFAGNEGDSLGSADIYIAFRQSDGSWGKPEHLGGDVNTKWLENAPTLGPKFGELYVSSNRQDEVRFPKRRDSTATLQQRLAGPLNGSRNIWRVDIADVLRAHGLND
jgi:Tol biopolymer transport system component